MGRFVGPDRMELYVARERLEGKIDTCKYKLRFFRQQFMLAAAKEAERELGRLEDELAELPPIWPDKG